MLAMIFIELRDGCVLSFQLEKQINVVIELL